MVGCAWFTVPCAHIKPTQHPTDGMPSNLQTGLMIEGNTQDRPPGEGKHILSHTAVCASLGRDGFPTNTRQVPAYMILHPEVVALQPRQHPLYPVLARHRPCPPDQLPATHRAPAARLNAAAAQPW